MGVPLTNIEELEPNFLSPLQERGYAISSGESFVNSSRKEKGLTNKYQTIMEGDKIKFLELRQPNSLGSNVISFIGKFPDELDIHRFIDYDVMYIKSFIEPLSFITNIIDWKIDRSFGTQTTLEDFFG